MKVATVATAVRMEKLRAAIVAAPGMDVETLCTYLTGVHPSSVHNMLVKLEAAGVIYRRRPGVRTLWFPCAVGGVDLLTKLYTPDVNALNVEATRHVKEKHTRAPIRKDKKGAQSSLNGAAFRVSAQTVGGRRGGGD